MNTQFQDRKDAGQRLAGLLGHYAHRDDVVVLALPRGGVAIAYEITRAIFAPLDVYLVRKVGVPGQKEMAMGAVASGGVTVRNEDIIHSLRISESDFQAVADAERRELRRREEAYRPDRPPHNLRDRTVLLVDDGLATGATMRAAIHAVRRLDPRGIVVCSPTGSAYACSDLRRETLVDEVVCYTTPQPFHAVGQSYLSFPQCTDQEVRDLLARAERDFRPLGGGLRAESRMVS
jgi:predicted phosphoribosyltransferase